MGEVTVGHGCLPRNLHFDGLRIRHLFSLGRPHDDLKGMDAKTGGIEGVSVQPNPIMRRTHRHEIAFRYLVIRTWKSVALGREGPKFSRSHRV